MENWLVRARRIAGRTEEECACAIRQPLAAYRELEQHPGRLTLNEVATLHRALGEASTPTIEGALRALLQ